MVAMKMAIISVYDKQLIKLGLQLPNALNFPPTDPVLQNIAHTFTNTSAINNQPNALSNKKDDDLPHNQKDWWSPSTCTA